MQNPRVLAHRVFSQGIETTDIILLTCLCRCRTESQFERETDLDPLNSFP